MVSGEPESETPSMLFTVVGMLILAAIVVAIILLLYGAQVGQQDFIDWGNLFPSRLTTERYDMLATLIEEQEAMQQNVMQTTSTEIACDIALAMRDDFAQYGSVGSGQDDPRPDNQGMYRKSGIDGNQERVAFGVFKIKYNNASKSFWSFGQLLGQQRTDLMRTCSETGERWNCSTPYLDEECVSNALGHLQIGDNLLCTQKKNGTQIKVMARGALETFGNDNCGGNGNVADGTDSCKTLCPGGDKIGGWAGPKGLGVELYEDDADWGDNSWPPFNCDLPQAGINLPACEPLYLWSLIYNRHANHYVVEFMRIPENINLGKISTDQLMNDLIQNDARKRNVESGYFYPQARTRWDLTFQPTDQITITSLLTKMTDRLGAGWNVVTEQCTGTDCFESEVRKMGWRVLNMQFESKKPIAPEPFDPSEQPTKIRTAAKEIKVKLGSAGGQALQPDILMDPTHTYRVMLRWWEHTHETGYMNVGCGFCLYSDCVVCLEDNGNYAINRCAGDCRRESDSWAHYKEHNDVTRWMDYTLIIIDEGKIGGED